MYIFVEERIKEAIKNGEFDNLPGMGKPLDFSDELPGLSPELKMAYKVLKNSGYIAETTKTKKENISFKDLYTCATDEKDKAKYQKRMEFYEFIKNRKLYTNPKFATYADKIFKKLF